MASLTASWVLWFRLPRSSPLSFFFFFYGSIYLAATCSVLGLPEEFIYAVFRGDHSRSFSVFSASWFDSGYMLLPVYVFVGTRILRSILVLLSVVFSFVVESTV